MSAPATIDFDVFVSPSRSIDGDRGTFSPVTSTLIYGAHELVLVDAQFVDQDVTALGDAIQATGRALTTIVATHGHGDHWYGAEALLARFPGSEFVTTAGVAHYIDEQFEGDSRWMLDLFGDRVTIPQVRPAPLTVAVTLEGHELRIIEVGQGDIAPSSILQVPELGLIVAGDIVYNRIHQMLAFGGPSEWEQWISSVDAIEQLGPRYVVAGHKQPGAPDDQITEVLDGTRNYIRDFTAAVDVAHSARDIIHSMRTRYPNHGNVTTLVASAAAAIATRPGQL